MACKTNVSSLTDGAGTVTAPQIRHPANEDAPLRNSLAGLGSLGSFTPDLPTIQRSSLPCNPAVYHRGRLNRPVPLKSASRPGLSGALTTTEAAAFLGVSERTLRRYLTLGLLSYGRLPGGHYRLRRRRWWSSWRGAGAKRRDTRRTWRARPNSDLARPRMPGACDRPAEGLCPGITTSRSLRWRHCGIGIRDGDDALSARLRHG